MLAGVLAQSGIRLDRLLAWAEVFGVMRMLRTAAAATIHALCSAFSFFKLKVLILKRLCTLYVHLIYRHLKAKQSIKTLAESSRIIFCRVCVQTNARVKRLDSGGGGYTRDEPGLIEIFCSN